MPAKATNYKQDILKLSSNWQERTWQISIRFTNISVDYTEFRIVLLQKPQEDPQFFMSLPKLLKCGSCRGGVLLFFFFPQTPPCCKYWSIKQTYEVNIQCLTGCDHKIGSELKALRTWHNLHKCKIVVYH